MMRNGASWLLFSYKVPAEPSTLRVRIWRTLKSVGVLYIQQSVCLIPVNPDSYKKLQQTKKLVDENGGDALLLEINDMSEDSAGELIGKCNAQRSVEYGEFMDGCRSYRLELETETAKRNFTFHEVEENEADLLKLKRWYRKIIKRDFFACPAQIEAAAALQHCEEQLLAFTEHVYRQEGKLEGDIQ